MVVFFIILAVIIIFIIFMFNSVITLKQHVDRAKSLIDVYLQQRFDLIPNLVNVTKEYIHYESNILEKITELRSLYTKNKDENAKNELNSQYKTIMLVSENYPQLKSSEQFLNLQKSLIKIESQLQAARRIYNNDVTKYNTKIATFPNNFIAKLFNFKQEELFQLEGEDNVEVNF